MNTPNMSVTEYLRANAQLHDSKESLFASCINDLGCAKESPSKRYYDIQKSNHPIQFRKLNSGYQSLPVPNNKIHRISEIELRKKHDIKFIITQNASNIREGEFIMERDFIQQCNVSNSNGYRQYLESGLFDQYRGKVSGITYWSHPKSIQKMKDEGILR